jgi:hypothetical protein
MDYDLYACLGVFLVILLINLFRWKTLGERALVRERRKYEKREAKRRANRR